MLKDDMDAENWVAAGLQAEAWFVERLAHLWAHLQPVEWYTFAIHFVAYEVFMAKHQPFEAIAFLIPYASIGGVLLIL